MIAIPAFCDTCGTSFPSGIVVGNIAQLNMAGNKSGPCPACGGWGSVPDGVFHVLNDVIEIIDAPRKTIEQLAKYIEILNVAKKGRYTRVQVEEQLQAVPELACLAPYLPKNFSDLMLFLTFLLSLFQVVSQYLKDDNPIENNIIINQTINNVKQIDSVQPQVQPKKNRKVGRNEPCICGSGNKYKKCCGVI